MQVTGKVEQIKEKQTKFGAMYDVVVNGQSYGHGKYPPRGIQAGDHVTLDVEVKQNGQYTNYNIAKGGIRKEDGAAPSNVTPINTQPASAATTPYAGKSPYVPFDERQEMISKQSALNTALSFCNLASANGAVPMPKAAKESEKLGLLYQWFLDTAGGLYKLSTGREWALPEGTSPASIDKPQAKAKAVAAPAEADTGYQEYGG
jgi:hypothetical protein